MFAPPAMLARQAREHCRQARALPGRRLSGRLQAPRRDRSGPAPDGAGRKERLQPLTPAPAARTEGASEIIARTVRAQAIVGASLVGALAPSRHATVLQQARMRRPPHPDARRRPFPRRPDIVKRTAYCYSGAWLMEKYAQVTAQ